MLTEDKELAIEIIKEHAKEVFEKVCMVYSEGASHTNSEIKNIIKYKGPTENIGKFIWLMTSRNIVEKKYVITGRKAGGSGRYRLFLTDYGKKVKKELENK